MRILTLAGRRLAASIPTVLLILIGIFILLQFAPGDTVDAMMAQMGGGDAATARELRKFYGLDLSVTAQLGNYLWRLVRFDLGFSAIYGKPVAAVIAERLPVTILLMTASLSFAFFVGLVLGVVAARRVNKWPDTLISTLGLIFYATPSFWFGLMAIVVFSIYLQWLPPGGFEDITTVRTGIWRFLDIARHLVLPTLTLGFIFLAIYLRIMRASMLEVLNLDFVRTARAKGLDETRVVVRHVLRNAMLPMVTLIGSVQPHWVRPGPTSGAGPIRPSIPSSTTRQPRSIRASAGRCTAISSAAPTPSCRSGPRSSSCSSR